MKPDTQAIAITRADGGLSVMRFITRGVLNDAEVFERKATPEAVEAEIAKSGIDAVSWRLVDESDLPADRTFRNAWTDNNGKIDVDMPKAREIAHAMRRGMRDEELAPLDKQINIDIALPAKIAATEAQRQVVRDKYAALQSVINTVENPDELKAALGLKSSPTVVAAQNKGEQAKQGPDATAAAAFVGGFLGGVV